MPGNTTTALEDLQELISALRLVGPGSDPEHVAISAVQELKAIVKKLNGPNAPYSGHFTGTATGDLQQHDY